jgi:hypothetical protein
MPEKAQAWPMSGDGVIAILAGGVFLATVSIGLAANQISTHDSKQYAWIDAKETTRMDNYLKTIPPSITSVVKINENAFMHSSNNNIGVVGYVYPGETYIIEGEKEVEGSMWYKIKIGTGHRQ